MTVTAASLLVLTPSYGAETDAHPWIPSLLGGQYTLIDQRQSSLHSPYQGENSLLPDGDDAVSQTFGVYFGGRIVEALQYYVDVEMFKGRGVSGAVGLGGLTNGDVIRGGTQSLSKAPYLARYFLRYSLPLGSETEEISAQQDQLASNEHTHRIEIKAGRMAVSDDFDRSRYANSPRTQFLNWSLFNNTAWDFAADTRGYTEGIVLAYAQPSWSLRYGAYLMPRFANGQELDTDFSHARGEQVEFDWQPDREGPSARVMAYRNLARMGVYRDALVHAAQTESLPSIQADDQPGRHKYGFALGADYPLADHGNTGAFVRIGWNDGQTESFAFTEVDRTLNGGVQISGSKWRRVDDSLAIAVSVNELSGWHRAYLAAGGSGFVLGDGALHYGRESAIEANYRWHVVTHVDLTPDVQWIDHPGYNSDRGPVWFAALRLHLEL